MRIEGPRTLFLIFGKSDGWWSKIVSHGDGANVDPAARLVCVALGSWRLVSRNDETSAELEAPCVAKPDQDVEGLFADAGDASVLVHDDDRVTRGCLP